jgi:arginyl-tRNA synthetase
MNALAEFNEQVRKHVETVRDARIAAHEAKTFPRSLAYPLTRLKCRIAEALSERGGRGSLELQFEPIQRSRFGGDLAVRIPQLLGAGGPKEFIKDHLPWITEVLSAPGFADAIARVETKGMYVNITLTDRWLLNGAQFVVDLGPGFGANDSLVDRVIIVDYSSPNVAKVLHAGHIRSTIIGHVLGNLYEQCGALVYRVNHINDFGGFGFTLEGYRRFKEWFPAGMTENELLLELYRIRRTGERVVEGKVAFTSLGPAERDLLTRYFPGVSSANAFRARFAEFVAASDARFAGLEAGRPEEVTLWRQMVSWSLAEFDWFYQALGVQFDLVLGESFYFQAGNALVTACLKAGTAVVYSESIAAGDIRALNGRMDHDELTPAERDAVADSMRKDIGAVVVRLNDAERYVVRRADGLSIYSTRDLGAIQRRIELFNPTDIVYVVGQEQRVHFDRLFKTAYRIGLADPNRVQFRHLYFGFYTDAKTRKKLSSRDTVASVNHLLTASVNHFRSRLSDRVEQDDEECAAAARQLAVGSLVFNDLKQDLKSAVEIDTADLGATIAAFEKSGGAYMAYTACRARSILRKYGKEPARAEEITAFELDDQEVALLLKLQEMPERIALCAELSNPSILVRYLLDLAAIYNSYYARAPVIQSGQANASRLLITNAIQQALINGLKLCHVECPAMI